MSPPLLTTTQAAARLGVRRQTVHGWIARGLLPAARLGRQWVIEEADLESFTPPGKKRGCFTRTAAFRTYASQLAKGWRLVKNGRKWRAVPPEGEGKE